MMTTIFQSTPYQGKAANAGATMLECGVTIDLFGCKCATAGNTGDKACHDMLIFLYDFYD